MRDEMQTAWRRRLGRDFTALCLGIAVAATLLPAQAKAWWNDDWQLRKKITIDASASGANITDPIGSAPVLIRLHVGNFRFGSSKEDGSDLRFVAGDDKTPLKFHVEKYDSLLGEALIWVAVPNLSPGTKSDIWLYSGNKKAIAVADSKASYDPDTLLVYHFSERGTPALDSTAWANNAQSVGQPADGAIIGTALRLDGNAPLTLPASPSLASAANGAFTWSAWIKPAVLQPGAALYSRRDNGNAIVIGLDNGAPFVEISNAGTVQRSSGGAPIAAGTWHHVAVAGNAGQTVLYLDGVAYASLGAALPALSGIALVGGDTATAVATPPAAATVATDAAASASDAASGATPPAPEAAPAAVAAMAGFVGDLDELQLAKVARPAGFIRLAALGQGPDPTKLVAFSLDEETASWLSGYFAVILKSVTLDGWVVIGVLMIMAVLSWIVMIDRVSYLNRQAKANAKFMEAFREIGDLTVIERGGVAEAAPLGGAGDADVELIRASALHRVYAIGASEIRHRFDGRSNRRSVLSATSIAAIRAALDGGFIKETQRLNRLMVFLTIAISGGPFLGLLGTVVGVMITFAAIAASGDVNINAIAPGIAAALVATVAGLVVAIPALFGYNYLITRIKDLTSDIQVFIDEFVTKLAESYAADRPEHIKQRFAAE
ncbi:MAG TPA: DUF2341 domain-containing protein [Rhodopseudomonas sp.]|uniref:DUF2341 domain-containing protein n=1 Tax=Rhodopseudomonas sp. TaxID=1078 RepID=UPI002ED86DCF